MSTFCLGFHRGEADQFAINLHSKLDLNKLTLKLTIKFNKIFFVFYICDLECLIYSNIKQIEKKKKENYF